MEVAFDVLKNADLVVDTVYKGGTINGKAAEVLSKLMPGCSNSGGFRKIMRKDGSGLPAFVVLWYIIEKSLCCGNVILSRNLKQQLIAFLTL